MQILLYWRSPARVVFSLHVFSLHVVLSSNKLILSGQGTGSGGEKMLLVRVYACACVCVCAHALKHHVLSLVNTHAFLMQMRPQDCSTNRHYFTKPQERLLWCYLRHLMLWDKENKERKVPSWGFRCWALQNGRKWRSVERQSLFAGLGGNSIFPTRNSPKFCRFFRISCFWYPWG